VYLNKRRVFEWDFFCRERKEEMLVVVWTNYCIIFFLFSTNLSYKFFCWYKVWSVVVWIVLIVKWNGCDSHSNVPFFSKSFCMCVSWKLLSIVNLYGTINWMLKKNHFNHNPKCRHRISRYESYRHRQTYKPNPIFINNTATNVRTTETTQNETKGPEEYETTSINDVNPHDIYTAVDTDMIELS